MYVILALLCVRVVTEKNFCLRCSRIATRKITIKNYYDHILDTRVLQVSIGSESTWVLLNLIACSQDLHWTHLHEREDFNNLFSNHCLFATTTKLHKYFYEVIPITETWKQSKAGVSIVS